MRRAQRASNEREHGEREHNETSTAREHGAVTLWAKVILKSNLQLSYIYSFIKLQASGGVVRPRRIFRGVVILSLWSAPKVLTIFLRSPLETIVPIY
jgi:hypothetical protein